MSIRQYQVSAACRAEGKQSIMKTTIHGAAGAIPMLCILAHL